MPETLEAMATAAEAAGKTPATETPVETEAKLGAGTETEVTEVVTTETTETTPAEKPAEQVDDSKTPLLDYCKEHWEERFGKKFDLSKYQTDEQFIDSVPGLWQVVGQRDEDAVVGKKYRGQESQIDDFLTGLAEKNGEPAPTDAMPSWNEIQLLRTKVYDKQGQVRQDVDPGDVKAWGAINDRMSQAIHALSTDPTAMFKPMIDDLRKELQASASADQTVQHEQHEIDAWTEKNKDQLFIGGDPNAGFTPLGQRMSQVYVEYEQHVPNNLQRLQLAERLVKAETPKTPEVKGPPTRSLRKPNVAVSKTDDAVTPESMFRAGKSLAEVSARFQNKE